MESRLAEAARGDADALYDLGMAYSTGSGGVDVDLIEAHKWFNLAALNGSEEAKTLVKGAIPPVDYANAFLLDIGAQNTKGGYIDELEDNKLEFIPLELNFGTMTLTDAVQKTVTNQNQANDMSTYQEK